MRPYRPHALPHDTLFSPSLMQHPPSYSLVPQPDCRDWSGCRTVLYFLLQMPFRARYNKPRTRNPLNTYLNPKPLSLVFKTLKIATFFISIFFGFRYVFSGNFSQQNIHLHDGGDDDDDTSPRRVCHRHHRHHRHTGNSAPILSKCSTRLSLFRELV